jgi:hypothetical protein
MLTGQRSSILVFALVIGSMFALLSVSMMYTSMSPKEKLIQELQAARTNVNLARMINPENICFTLDNETLGRYPSLAQAIKEADKKAEDGIRRNEHYGNYYAGAIVNLDRSQMLSLLRTYNFNETVSQNPSLDRFFTYEDRNFNCGFNYSDKHYLLTLFFTTFEQVNTDRGYVPIHITQRLAERAESPITNVTTYAPFNATAIFFNELSNSSVTIDVTSKNGGISDTIILLPNKMQDIGLRPNWTTLQNTDFQYKVKEYPWIEGEISVSPRYNSECMSKEVTKSLYSQSEFEVKFPTYLPEGFKPACNAENLPSYVIQIYVNQTAVDNYRKSGAMSSRDNPYPFYLYAGMPEEQVEGIVQVHAQKYYVPSENPREMGYSVYQSMLNDTAAGIGYRTNPHFFNDDVNNTSYLTYNEGKFLSVVNVLMSDESYRVVGALPMEEVMKIAKSLSEENVK